MLTIRPRRAVATEPEETLSRERAVASALERVPYETAQSARLEAIDGERRRARAWPNPTFSYEREQHWEEGAVPAEDFFVLEQSIPVWGERALRAEAAEARREATAAANADERHERRIAVERAFFAVLRERRSLEAARELRAEIAEAVETMEKRREADEVSRYAVDRLRASLVDAEATVDGTRADLVAARAELAVLVGRSATPVDDWRVRGDLMPRQVPPLEGLLDGLEARPDLAELRARARDAMKREAAAGRDAIPTPTLSGGYRRIDDPTGGSLHGLIVGVSLELPVFNQGGGVRQSASARQTRLTALERLEHDRAETELRAAHRVAELRREVARRYRNRAVSSAKKLVERARQRQHSGEESLVGLVEAYRRLYEAEIGAIDREWKAREAVIEVKRHAGGFS